MAVFISKVRTPFCFLEYPSSCSVLFIVTEKSPISAVHMCGDDVIGNFCIANEGDSEQGADNKFQRFETHRKNALNEAIVEKSPCI